MRISIIGKGNVGGGLEKARVLEDHLGLMSGINEAGIGQFFYRIAKPGEL